MKKLFWMVMTLASGIAVVPTALAFESVDDSPARFASDVKFDILDIRPGDTLEEVKAKLAALFPGEGPAAETRLEGNVAHPNGTQVPINYVSELKRATDSGLPPLYRNGKAGDWPTVYFASEVYGNRALAVARSLYFDKKEMMGADAMRLQIEEKYGKPTLVQRSSEGHVERMQYFYSASKLLAETPRKLGVGETCTTNANYEDDCETYSKTRTEENGKTVYTLRAKSPCAAMAEFNFSKGRAAEYKYMGDTRVVDDACDGILTVSFIGPSAKLDRVDFYLDDVKRSYGHKLALDAAINKALTDGGSAPAAKPRL